MGGWLGGWLSPCVCLVIIRLKSTGTKFLDAESEADLSDSAPCLQHLVCSYKTDLQLSRRYFTRCHLIELFSIS